VTAPVKLAAFVVALLAVLAAGYGVGAAVGPDPTRATSPAPTTADPHGWHAD